jgi:hypothetical protein
LFVAEHAGPLSIVDKTTRRPVTYINFNGSADAPGLFPKFAPTGGFVSGLMGFAFDPDYRRNGVFYTIHLENPALTGEAKPKAGVLPALDPSRFVATKPIGMPANGQTLTREAVVSEWTDSNRRGRRDLHLDEERRFHPPSHDHPVTLGNDVSSSQQTAPCPYPGMENRT